jgi:hypothetical protein
MITTTGSRDRGFCDAAFEFESRVFAVVVEGCVVCGFAFAALWCVYAWLWWRAEGEVERVDALGLPFDSESESSDDDEEDDVAGSEGEW